MQSGPTGEPAGTGTEGTQGAQRQSGKPGMRTPQPQQGQGVQGEFRLPNVAGPGAPAQGQRSLPPTRTTPGPTGGPARSQPSPSPTRPSPSLAATNAGRSLGVGNAMSRPPGETLGRVSVTSAPLRLPTLTGQMRAVRPPDVARQAIDELRVLARELGSLPETLDTSGLARIHWNTFNDALDEYLTLSQDAWEAVAEERLEQAGAETEYRERAVSIQRRVTRLQSESQKASNNTQFPLPHKTPGLWNWRTRTLRDGLNAWERRLSVPADALKMGRGLFVLRGAAGLARAGALDVVLLRLLAGLTYTALAFTALGGLLFVFLVAAFSAGALTGPVPALPSYLPQGVAGIEAAGGIAVVALTIWILLRMLLATSHAPLDVLLGASLFSANRSPSNGGYGSAFVTGLLRVISLLVSGVGVVGIPAALAFAAVQQWAVIVPKAAPTTAPAWIALVGDLLLRLVTLPAIVGVAASLLLALVVLVVTAWRFTAELGGHRSWMPPARRYALDPALTVLGFLGGALFAAVAIATIVAGWQPSAFASVVQGEFTFSATARAIVLFLALVLPYFLLLELPYRVGIGRWRHNWLSELQTRRADVESHIRRLSAISAERAAQDANDENLRAMQYDLVLLQFYQSKTDEARRISSAPTPLLGVLFILLLAAAAALLADGGALALLHLIPGA